MYDILTRFLSEGVEGMKEWTEMKMLKLVALICGLSAACALIAEALSGH